MKLRNKKTGEIINAMFYAPIGKYGITIWRDTDYLQPTCDRHWVGDYKTITELNEEWEDYKPAEPLIKDEKIRKAVRAWAEAECITKAYLENDYTICRDDAVDASISFYSPVFKGVGDTSDYTIAELCGEEEE